MKGLGHQDHHFVIGDPLRPCLHDGSCARALLVLAPVLILQQRTCLETVKGQVSEKLC